MNHTREKIVFIVSAMNLGGAQRAVSILCNYWAANNFEIKIIVTYSGEKICHYNLDSRIRLIYLNDEIKLTKFKVLNFFIRIYGLRSIIQSLKPKVVISFLHRVNIATIISMWNLNIPLIVSERTYPPFRSSKYPLKLFNNFLFKKCNKVIVQTKMGFEWFKKHYPEIKAEVIPNAIVYPMVSNNKRIFNNYFNNNDNVILAAGRLAKEKQFNILINVFLKISNNFANWKLAIIGEGTERNKLEDLINKANLQKKVILPGKMDNLSEWYNNSKIFILCSKYEGFPNVLLEAMAHSLPSISLDCDTGPRDIIINGINGFLVDENNASDGLYEKTVSLIKSKDLRSKFSKNAIEVREKYSIEKIEKIWRNSF